MRLISQKKQHINIGQTSFLFQDQEIIHTENSYKYSLDMFKNLAKDAGWSVAKIWVDKNKLFSVQFLIHQ